MANIIGDDFSNKDGGSVDIYAENRRKPYVHDGMGTNCEWLMINEGFHIKKTLHRFATHRRQFSRTNMGQKGRPRNSVSKYRDRCKSRGFKHFNTGPYPAEPCNTLLSLFAGKHM